MARSLNILAVSPFFPRSDVAAGWGRLVAMLEILARRHRVDLYVLWPEPEDDPRPRRALEELGVRVLSHPPWRCMERAMLRRAYDLGLFEFWDCAEVAVREFRRRQPWARVVVDSVDVNFLREEAGLSLGISQPQAVASRKERELRVYREADALVVITPEDRAALETCGCMPPMYTIPIILPLHERSGGGRGPELLFIGGFKHAPNADGLLWFARAIWPAVRSGVAEARLTVVGSHPTPEVLALGDVPGIEVVGYVPETGPYLDRASASVAPLRFGAGMKGKVIEAMASALPVVTTTVGAQGLGATPGEHLFVADDAGAFAARVVELLRDRARAESMGRAGQGLVASLCTPEAAGRRLDELLAGIGASRPSIPPAWWWREALWFRGGGLARGTATAVRSRGRRLLGAPTDHFLPAEGGG